ncbi:MAG: LysM peptidoglycan-binding domain-containing protein [Gammaproteobacteria bacterium]|nr:LysM peptidoglycan-binding domain-containing protein [Gammaproteobacteria bacterium]
MTDKKRNSPPRVMVHGKLTGQIDKDGTEHQVYRYHVNILGSKKSSSHEYDKEIHIFKSNASQKADTTPANAGHFTDSKKNRPAKKPQAKKPVKTKSPTTSTKKSIFKMPAGLTGIKIKPQLPSISFSLPKLALPKIKLPHPSLKLKNPLPGLLLSVRSKVKSPFSKTHKSTTTNKKPDRKNKLKDLPKLFSGKFNRRNIIRFCLPCILLTAAAIAIYILPWPFKKQTIIYPIEKTATPETFKPNKDYRAVIEKTGQGVVITLQGPNHEEVLTKLPPGYDPVVEGNKIVHVVTPGNTLWFIAMRYIKNPYRYAELARLNNIKNPDLIYPGEKVIIQYIRKP